MYQSILLSFRSPKKKIITKTHETKQKNKTRLILILGKEKKKLETKKYNEKLIIDLM